MKINLTIETDEFLFIKYALQQQTEQLVRYMETMYQVAEHLDNDHNIEKKVNKDFDNAYANFKAEAQALGPETVVKAPKRRGRPPAKKRGRPAKAKV